MLGKIRYLYSRFGTSGLVGAIKCKLGNSNNLIKVRIKKIKAPFFLRLKTTDLPTFDQVFFYKEYDFDTAKSPNIIIDAGANIGLAAIYFANRYPNAKIIALEPEQSNFRILKENVSPRAISF